MIDMFENKRKQLVILVRLIDQEKLEEFLLGPKQIGPESYSY